MPPLVDCPVMPPGVVADVAQHDRAAAFQVLDDDAVLLILSCLARSTPDGPQALARAAQCSRRLQRLVDTESLWAALCRSEFPHAHLPTTGGTRGLQQCFAERVSLPLRLAYELDLVVGGLRHLTDIQSAATHSWVTGGSAEGWLTEPPIYSSSGLDRSLLSLAPTTADVVQDVSAVRPAGSLTVETLIMYRIFRVGLGLTTLMADSRMPPMVAPVTKPELASEQLRLLLEECESLLLESINYSRSSFGDGGWVSAWCSATQLRLEQFDPWGQGTLHWPDIPWRRSALGFLLQFFSPDKPTGAIDDGTLDSVDHMSWATNLRDLVVNRFDAVLEEIREDGEDLSLPRRWVPLGLPRRGVEAVAHKWWFEEPPDEAALAAFWGNRC
jgi:hypothetical protein